MDEADAAAEADAGDATAEETLVGVAGGVEPQPAARTPASMTDTPSAALNPATDRGRSMAG